MRSCSIVPFALLLVGVSAGPTAHLNWNCNVGEDIGSKGRIPIPDVCNNMCYGVKVLGLPSTLSYDKPSPKVQNQRTKGAGCGDQGRCDSSKEQCDEYPFKSTKPESSQANDERISRCVPQQQNSRQGLILSMFYSSRGIFAGGPGTGGKGLTNFQPGSFSMGFSHITGIPYCTGKSDTNDGQEKTRNGDGKVVLADPPKKRKHGGGDKEQTTHVGHNPKPKKIKKLSDLPTNGQKLPRALGAHRPHRAIRQRDPASRRLYRLNTGHPFYVPGGANVGDTVYTPKVHNGTLAQEMLDNHVYDPQQGPEQYQYMFHNMYFDQHSIVGYHGDEEEP